MTRFLAAQTRLSTLAAATCATLVTAVASTALAQTVTPIEIVSNPSEACPKGTESHKVCITLPPGATVDKVDIFLLFDDTGSFAGQVPPLVAVFNGIVSSLATALPAVDIAYGVGRFEDFGGPGASFGAFFDQERPFILNQAIYRTVNGDFFTKLNAGLSNTTPGGGGDGPESAIEGLFQVATGFGFDGNCNGSTSESGPAGALATQLTPGTSGDVPTWASHVGSTDGTLGGVGWRPGSLRLVILATDICSIVPFDSSLGIPATVTGTGGTEPTSAFACNAAVAGDNRFGYVSDTCDAATNTIAGAVAPKGAATLPATISALNSLGIRVIGLGPGAVPTNGAGRDWTPSTFLSSLARLTGAVDTGGTPLVFDINGGPAAVAAAIVSSVTTAATAPIDITLNPTPLPDRLVVTWTPPVHTNVHPGDTVCFDVDFTGTGTFEGGNFPIHFLDPTSGTVLGSIPVQLVCAGCSIETEQVLCAVGPSDDGTVGLIPGCFDWTFTFFNDTATTANYLLFPVDNVDPQIVVFSPPVGPGESQTVTVRVCNVGELEGVCIPFIAADEHVNECCHGEVCFYTPDCDCIQFTKVSATYSPGFGTTDFLLNFDIQNLATYPIKYSFFLPENLPAGSTIIPPFRNLTLFGPLFAPVPQYGIVNGVNTTVKLPVSPVAGTILSIRVTVHEPNLVECCSEVLYWEVDYGPGGNNNPCDLNGDAIVDGADLGILLSAWGSEGPGDIDESGEVDGSDLGALLACWS